MAIEIAKTTWKKLEQWVAVSNAAIQHLVQGSRRLDQTRVQIRVREIENFAAEMEAALNNLLPRRKGKGFKFKVIIERDNT